MLNTNESLSEKFIKKGFWLYFFTFLISPIGYIVRIIISYDLKVEEIWILYWIISLVSLLCIYHDLGLTESLNYFLPKYLVEKNYSKIKSILAYTFFAQFPTSILIWILIYFWAWFLATSYFHSEALINETKTVLQIFCLFFVWLNLFSIVNTVYWATQNTKLQKWTEFIRMFSILCFTLWFWFLDKWTLLNYAWNWNMWLWVGIVFSYLIFYFQYYKPYLKDVKIIYNKELFTKLFSYAFWVLIATNIATILGQVDMQLIIYILWLKDAWYYSNYLSIIWIPFLFTWPIIVFLFPVISSLHSWKNEEKIKLIKTMFYKYFTSLALIISWFMFVFWPEIAIILFWEKFRFSWVILQYSAFFIVFNFLLQINFQILTWTWKVKDRMKILWIGLIINIILNIILINFFKTYSLWAAWSSLAVWLSWIPLFLLSNKATKEYSWKFDIKFFMKNAIFTIILCLIFYYFLKQFFINATRLESLFLILIIWFFYIIPIILLNLKEIKLFVTELKRIKKLK